MKRKNYILGIIFCCFCLAGCCFMKKTAKDAVKDLMNQYKMLSANVLTDLEQVIKEEDFNKDEQDIYRDIMKKQYRDLKYMILDETYDGDSAIVKVKITVYDLFKAQNDAALYLNTHLEEFKDELGTYDNKKYLNYKLKQMKKTTETVEYTLNINVTKDKKGKWQVKDLSKNDLEKIHGIYNYNE